MDDVAIVIRSAKPSDKNFVFATWLKGQYFGSAHYRAVHQEVYYREYTKIIVKTLNTPGCEIKIACDSKAPDWVVGFCVLNGDEIHWVHVKKDYRERGIAKLLVGQRNITKVKSSTKIGAAITKKKGLIFDPF